jgi:hypothetical protein
VRPSVDGVYDLAAIGIAALCFACVFALLYVLERV